MLSKEGGGVLLCVVSCSLIQQDFFSLLLQLGMWSDYVHIVSDIEAHPLRGVACGVHCKLAHTVSCVLLGAGGHKGTPLEGWGTQES